MLGNKASIWLALVGVAILLQSCAKKTPQDEAADRDLVARYKSESLEESKTRARAAQVRCGIPGTRTLDCARQPVGLLTVATDFNIGSCTAFLVGPDLVATNSHCIPDEIKSGGVSCRDRLWVRFYGDAGDADRYECAELLAASALVSDGAGPDYAFLRLSSAPKERSPLRISRAGFSEDVDFRIVKMTPENSADQIASKMGEQTCRPKMRSLFFPGFDSSLREVVTFGDCKVIHGNSGAPMISQSGEALGIVQAYLDPGSLISLKVMQLKEQGLLFADRAQPLNFGTNFACITPPGVQGLAPQSSEESCRPPSQQDLAKIHTHAFSVGVAQHVRRSLEPPLNNWVLLGARDMRREFEWRWVDLPGTTSGRAAIAAPKCYRDAQKVADASGFKLSGLKAEFKLGFDDYLRPTYREQGTHLNSLSVQFDYSAVDVRAGRATPFKVSVDGQVINVKVSKCN